MSLSRTHTSTKAADVPDLLLRIKEKPDNTYPAMRIMAVSSTYRNPDPSVT